MANLGSENTPIEGESFGLPSGYSFDEENGDLVIRDTDGTVAMRRADGTWELESDLALNENDMSGVGAFDSESVNTGSVEIDNNQIGRIQYEIASISPEENTDSISLTDIDSSDADRIIIDTEIRVRSTPSDLRLRLNNIEDDDYFYFRQDGTKESLENSYLVSEGGSFRAVNGDIVVGLSGSGQPGVGIYSAFGTIDDDTTGYSDTGGLLVGDDITDIEFFLPDESNEIDNRSEITVYGEVRL